MSPNDPKPSIKVEGGKVVELDGKSRDEFDMIDTWIADHVIDVSVAEKAMALDSLQVARMLVDINVPRSEIVRLSVGMTPAKYVDVLKKMNVVELMMAKQKLRSRRTPSQPPPPPAPAPSAGWSSRHRAGRWSYTPSPTGIRRV